MALTSVGRGNNQYYSSPFWVEYLAFGSDIDLTSASYGAADMTKGGGGGQNCRRIRIGSAGNIALKRPDGTSITTTGLVAGEVLDVEATTILAAGTTITNCTVYW